MKTKKTVFGSFQDKDISLFELHNDKGMLVKIMNYGATITSISIPGKEGNRVELACGFDSFESYFSEEYISNAPYFGCTVGRYSSQIKNSSFKLDGIEYMLDKNCGENNLHGGKVGFDKKIWEAEEYINDNSVGLHMTLLSKDMEEGFPGNVEVKVRFSLNNNNEICIDYKAITDKATPLSLTNHTYFNLSGFKTDITEHQARIHTNKRLGLDETGAATGVIVLTQDTADDMRAGKSISDAHRAIGAGFEHFYVFDNPGFNVQKVAEVEDPKSNRKLEVSSSEPCMLFYTGKYTSDLLIRENGDKFGKYRGFCCETHRYPNGPNIPNSPKSITYPGLDYTSKTIFKISW